MNTLLIFFSFFVFLLRYECTAQNVKLRDRNTKSYRILCYYGSRAGNRHGDGFLAPDELDPQACTHLIYASATLRENSITPRDSFLDLEDNWGKGFYKKMNGLRHQNPTLTTLVAIGEREDGSNTESAKFSKMASKLENRKIFVQSVVDFLKKFDFDGLDLVWEYAAARGETEDQENYISLLKELSTAFEPHGFLLSVAVPGSKKMIETAYDVPQISKYADIINVMAFDYHGTWETRTGANAPLYARPDEMGDDRLQNIDSAILTWISRGADKKKLTLGLPMYGRCFRLADRNNYGYSAPAPHTGSPGPFTQKPGILGYNELCLNLKNQMWTVVWNDYHFTPYAYYGDQWCSYDEESSLTQKTKYLRATGLGGATILSLDTDDFKGLCSEKRFPLLSAIVAEMEDTRTKPELPTTPSLGSVTTQRTTLRPIGPSTEDPRLRDLCQEEGLVKVPGECSYFVQCVRENDLYRPIKKDCPPGTVFNENRSMCDFPVNVPECKYANILK